jgi:hypothetical protein
MKYKDVIIFSESTWTPKIKYKDYLIALKRSDIEKIQLNKDYIDLIIDNFLYSIRIKERSKKLKNILL